MYIRNAKNTKMVRSENGENTYELLGRVEAASENVSIAHIELEPGKEALRHQHENTEEVFYILSGQGTAKMNDEIIPIKEGDCIYIPGGYCHSLLNNTDEKLIYLSVCTPAWLRHSGNKC